LEPERSQHAQPGQKEGHHVQGGGAHADPIWYPAEQCATEGGGNYARRQEKPEGRDRLPRNRRDFEGGPGDTKKPSWRSVQDECTQATEQKPAGQPARRQQLPSLDQSASTAAIPRITERNSKGWNSRADLRP
jgi:hypothetical protein